MTLLFLESVGTTELLVILVAALVLFGPRKLPELGRTLGKSLGEFKRASDEFKKTWEREVELESTDKRAQIEQAMVPEIRPSQFPPEERLPRPSINAPEGAAVARGTEAATLSSDDSSNASPNVSPTDAPVPPTRKADWL